MHFTKISFGWTEKLMGCNWPKLQKRHTQKFFEIFLPRAMVYLMVYTATDNSHTQRAKLRQVFGQLKKLWFFLLFEKLWLHSNLTLSRTSLSLASQQAILVFHADSGLPAWHLCDVLWVAWVHCWKYCSNREFISDIHEAIWSHQKCFDKPTVSLFTAPLVGKIYSI